jgi:hypothetical protein
MKRGAAVGGVPGREDVDVAGVEAPAAESDVEEDDDDDEDEALSTARRRRAGFKGASEDLRPDTEAELLALYAAQEDWICSRERGFRLLRSASRASKHTTQCSTVAILGWSGETQRKEKKHERGTSRETKADERSFCLLPKLRGSEEAKTTWRIWEDLEAQSKANPTTR